MTGGYSAWTCYALGICEMQTQHGTGCLGGALLELWHVGVFGLSMPTLPMQKLQQSLKEP